MDTTNMATRSPVTKLERMKLMAVATNMAAVARFENLFRLLGFEEVLLHKKKRLGRQEKTNTNIRTDAEKRMINTPVMK